MNVETRVAIGLVIASIIVAIFAVFMPWKWSKLLREAHGLGLFTITFSIALWSLIAAAWMFK